MRYNFLLLILFASSTANSQIIVNTTIADSILYNALNYLQITKQQANNIYTVVYNNTLNPAYQMKTLYMDSAGTKLLSITFYHQNKLHGPYESYQMEKTLAKGRYKEGKLVGEKITYWANGTTMMEKFMFARGLHSAAL